MKHSEIRKAFLSFFEKSGHSIEPSSSLIPHEDPTILFTNAGMNQFKDYFLGFKKAPWQQVVTTQKCLRAGGKHNDLDNVGHTARHHTFFEMLGNFSFNSYFKEEAVLYCWKFLTEELLLDKDRLYISVFEKDDETKKIWEQYVPKSKIFKLGEKDNFWRMANVGPCGPNTEVYYDTQPNLAAEGENVVGGEGDKFVEIWNLVFMQYEEKEDGTMIPLKKTGVDTGMGLERLAAVLQNTPSNYHTDIFSPLFDKVRSLTNLEYDPSPKVNKEQEKQNAAFRILADHARAGTFLISNGALPSKEGRGYVLRRILRRGIRYGHELKSGVSLIPEIALTVIDELHSFYPELKQSEKLIYETLKDEEARFLKTLDQGLDILKQEIKLLTQKKQNIFPAKTVFKLYDTYGFPADLTKVILEEQKIQFKQGEFQKHLNEAKHLARSAHKQKSYTNETELQKRAEETLETHGETQFIGYDKLGVEHSTPIALLDENGCSATQVDSSGWVCFKQTPFYAESGGQIGDSGSLTNKQDLKASVIDTRKFSNVHFLKVKVDSGILKPDSQVAQNVNPKFRKMVTINHSATHLLHEALRRVLGEHITQAGSLVTHEKLRFDFTHKAPLSETEIAQVESIIQKQIDEAHETQTQVTSHKKALELGALALFGEKYEDKVRVLSIGEKSKELCGGCHVKNTQEIQVFKIISDSSVSSGVRRIEALTAGCALEYLNFHTRSSLKLRRKIGLPTSSENENELAEAFDKMKKEIKQRKQESKSPQITELSYEICKTNSHYDFVFLHSSDSLKNLRSSLDQLRNQESDKAIIITSVQKGRLNLLIGIGDKITHKSNAKDLLGFLNNKFGGSGGGKKDSAQGVLELPTAEGSYKNLIEEAAQSFLKNKI